MAHAADLDKIPASDLLAAPPVATTGLNQRSMPPSTHGTSCGVRTVRSATSSTPACCLQSLPEITMLGFSTEPSSDTRFR